VHMNTDKPKILCVDDEQVNLKLLNALLAPNNFEVIQAENGQQALERLKEQKIDIILLDVMMPEINGFEICRMIKEDPSIQNIPVVLVTALADRDSKLKGLKIGANDFITKPVDGSELIVRVKNLLRIKEFEDFLKRHNEILEEEVRKRFREHLGGQNHYMFLWQYINLNLWYELKFCNNLSQSQ